MLPHQKLLGLPVARLLHPVISTPVAMPQSSVAFALQAAASAAVISVRLHVPPCYFVSR